MKIGDWLDAPMGWEQVKCNAIDMLTPSMREPIRQVLQAINKTTLTHKWAVFETWRNPIRQEYLVKEGRSKTIISAHGYGMACDIVPIDNEGQWFWERSDAGHEAQWGILDNAVNRIHGLRKPIAWDRPHIEHMNWPQVRALLK